MEETAGEAHEAGLWLSFYRRIKVEFHGSKVTSDGGLLAFRELDDALGLSVIGLRTIGGIRGRERRRPTPAMRWVVGVGAVMGQAASASQMGRFETEAMTQATNLNALTDLSGQWIDRVHARRLLKIILLDMDSSEPDFRRAGGHGL